MNCFVTGASGFIGANLVQELVRRGHKVRALVRAGSDLRGLAGVDCELVDGDLADAEKLKRGMRGCDWSFHTAASYHLWLPDYRPMYRANVDGTRNVLEAAVAEGCGRIVYTSTVGCMDLSHERNGHGGARDESRHSEEAEMNNHYKRSKWQAEQLALGFAQRGAPVVIVNPTAPVGPRDVKPTPTGQVILDFMQHAMPAYLDTGLNWVHVRDVAVGHILAAERGKVGERYILGNAQGNWSMKDTFAVLEELTGIKAPRMRMPYWIAMGAAYANETWARVTLKPPRVPLSGVRMARHKMFYDPSKAIRELGLPQTPPREGMAEAVEWFRTNGYLRRN